MQPSFLDSVFSRAVKSSLNAAALNQRLISDNIANAETPGYKAWRLNFNHYFYTAKRALDIEKTDWMPPDPRSFIFRDSSTSMRLDGNNVDVEREMVELARNALTYSTMIELLQRRGKLIMMAVREGRV